MNLLLITADQWRGEALSLRGHPCARTPNLDRLANEGTVFLRHFSQATPCGPARASLHTGMYAMNHRSVSNGAPLNSEFTTMALEARRQGYDPVLFGYTDTSADPRILEPDDPRLTTYEGVLPGYRTELLLPEDAGPWLDHLAARGYGQMTAEEAYDTPLGEPARWKAEDSETAFVTDAFQVWLAAQPRQRPWFAHLSLIKPHPPFVAAAPFHEIADVTQMPKPVRRATIEEEARLHSWLHAHLERRFMGTKPPGHPREPADLRGHALAAIRRVYYGLVAEVDHHVGRTMEALRQVGAWEKTLVVFTSDHGEMLGDHWMLGKSGFFPQAFHVPCIIRDPLHDVGHGRRVQAWTEHVDLMPTLLGFLDINVPLQCDGNSLTPFLSGDEPPVWRNSCHYEHDFRDLENSHYEEQLGLSPESCAIAVQQGSRWAYVHFSGLPPLMFDTESDPGWLRDLANEPGHERVMLEEARSLLSFRMRNADRRLASCLLTPAGVIGRYDPLPPPLPGPSVLAG